MSPAFAPRPSRRAGRRLGVVAGPVAAGMILLAACGSGSDEGATESTIDLSEGSTAFVVRPPETTVAAETTVVAGGVSAAAQDYTIQSGDYPLKVAQQFGVTVDELVAFNEWGSANEFPFPGTVIKIPPGATVAAATPETTVAADPAAEAAATTTASTAPASTIPDAGDNCGAGEHIVEAGDIPINVAKKYDVTLDALNAANADNPAYGQFIPGQIIIIPGKAEC
jgi:LysM repeat protein